LKSGEEKLRRRMLNNAAPRAAMTAMAETLHSGVATGS
jgi:hypothetical protein